MTSNLAMKLTEDLKVAMRSGDTDRRDILRLLRSAVRNKEIELRREATDDDIVAVIEAEIKQRRDSIEAYSKANREDLVEAEQSELDLLEDYLPEDRKPISEDDLRNLVQQAVSELGLSSPADMRTLMPELIQRTSGRADNRLLSKLASEELRRRSES